MASYDVFIAYAGPNAPHARALHEALVGELGKDRVFFDKEQPPGSHWQQGVPKALNGSRLAAIVLSQAPDDGWWDKDEIVTAVAKRRKGKLEIVPVYVDGEPADVEDIPFGLRALVGVDVEAVGGMAATAAAIKKRLDSLPSPKATARRTFRTNRELLNAALHLDRADQWSAIQRVAHGNDDAYFLLYGQTFQNLRLFLDRIHHYLGKEVRPHLVLDLPYRLAGNHAATVAEWELRLATALKDQLNRSSGRLERLLEEAASSQPLFFLIELPWNQPFDDPHQQAMKTLVEERLPQLMAGCGGMGKRLLVAAEYPKPEISRHREISGWMRGAAANGTITYEPMAEVKTPSREDVVVFIQRVGFEEGDPQFDDIMRGYDQIAEDPSLDFERLSSFLDRQLRSSTAFVPASDDEEEYE